MRSGPRRSNDDRRPELSGCVEAAFPLAIGAEHAIGRLVPGRVEDAALVDAFDVFIHKRPDKSAGSGLALQDGVPVVAQACPGAAVVQAVQHLGRKEDGIGGELLQQQFIAGIVLGVGDAWRIGCPRMQDDAFLRVVFGEVAVERRIEAALVAVVPEDDRGVVDVMLHHLADQFLTDLGVVVRLPACEFIEHVEAELVAGIEEVAIGRIVAGADRVAVHLLDQVDVVAGDLRGQGSAGIGPERVAGKALEEDATSVDEQALSGPDFDGAEAKPLMYGVHDGAAHLQPHFKLVKIGRLCRPEFWIGDLLGELRCFVEGHIPHGYWSADWLVVSIEHLHLDRRPAPALGCCARVGEPDIDVQRTCCSGVDGQMVDEGFGHGLEENGPEDAAVVPVVSAALGVIHRVVHGVVIDVDLDFVLLTGGLEQVRDVVSEGVVAALVHGSGGLTVEGNPGVGHDALEVDEDGFVSPGCRRCEAALVNTVYARPAARRSGPSILVDAETLQLPVGRNADGGPLVGVLALVAAKLPLDRVVLAQAGEILRLRLGLRGPCHRSRKKDQPSGIPRRPTHSRPPNSFALKRSIMTWRFDES